MDQEPSRSISQKRCSQSQPRDKADSKKGHTEGDGRSSKVQVGIDWANMGIQKPVPKLDPHHLSFRPDPSGPSGNQLPWMRSSVTPRGSHRQSSSRSAPARPPEKPETQEKTSDRTSGLLPVWYPGDPEKRELKDKSHDWIAARIHRLDPKEYVEETHAFWHFGRNSKSFTLEIIAIADWGRKYMDAGFHYPIPVFPHYLFNSFTGSCQGRGRVPAKPDYLSQSGGDVCTVCTEAWIWMALILQFWADEVSIADGVLFGGLTHLVSALTEYVMTTINLHLETGYKVSWYHVIDCTTWMAKCLFNAMSDGEQLIQHQPIPVVAISSDLEVTMEKCYN